jgi:hypothetical protein
MHSRRIADVEAALATGVGGGKSSGASRDAFVEMRLRSLSPHVAALLDVVYDQAFVVRALRDLDTPMLDPGYFGMNFAYMPWLSVPYAAGLLLAFMGTVTAGLLLYFKRHDWFWGIRTRDPASVLAPSGRDADSVGASSSRRIWESASGATPRSGRATICRSRASSATISCWRTYIIPALFRDSTRYAASGRSPRRAGSGCRAADEKRMSGAAGLEQGAGVGEDGRSRTRATGASRIQRERSGDRQ